MPDSLLISDEWRDLNAKLHATKPDYGAGGSKYYQQVLDLLQEHGGATVLDYGCGKNTLANALRSKCLVSSYDPAIRQFAAEPSPADVVVCVDVMEHIEPGCVDAVLEHIRRLTLKVVRFSICCREAKRAMPDGRNAHISLHDGAWWCEQLQRRFRIEVLSNDAEEFNCLAYPL